MHVALERLNGIEQLVNAKIPIENISKIDQRLDNLKIPDDYFLFLGGERFKTVISSINHAISEAQSVIKEIKNTMGELRQVMVNAIKNSQNDINDFLKTAGINYELFINLENTRAFLKECFSDKKTQVSQIKEHLSWGERNAFSLILFLYFAMSQNPDLVILDDPVSSFDTNKKFAILHRLFKNPGKRSVSFDGKTVLLFTHDFEPIIDFGVVGKINQDGIVYTYINNNAGEIHQKIINPSTDVRLISKHCTDIAGDSGINKVSRIVFLRKLSEFYRNNYDEWDYVYNILSCLIHGKEKITKKNGINQYICLDEKHISMGIAKIKKYISDFEYDHFFKEVFSKESILQLYKNEENLYLKVQLFRELCQITGFSDTDPAWYKYIDETYHIENESVYCLDITKFNIVPDYIVDYTNSIISKNLSVPE